MSIAVLTPTAEEGAFRHYICRHLVSLSGTYFRLKSRAQSDEEVFCYSGFVVSIRDQWYYVTAGHVFSEQIVPNVEQEKIRIHRYAQADYFGPDASVREPLPFDFKAADVRYICDVSRGLDFAVIAYDGSSETACKQMGSSQLNLRTVQASTKCRSPSMP